MKDQFLCATRRKPWFKRILTVVFRTWARMADALQHVPTPHHLTVVILPGSMANEAAYYLLKKTERIILGRFKLSLLLNALPFFPKRIKYKHFNKIGELCNLALMYAKGDYICFVDRPLTREQIYILNSFASQDISSNACHISNHGSIAYTFSEHDTNSIVVYSTHWLRKIGGIDECNGPSFHSIARHMTHGYILDSGCDAKDTVYDILLMPHKKYHATTMAEIGSHLLQSGLSLAFADISVTHGDEGANELVRLLDIPKFSLAKLVTSGTMYRALFCMCDWDNGAGMRLIKESNAKGIPTIALVEGVQDFLDSDTFMLRKPYRHARHILLAGEHDRKYFPSTVSTRVVGVPRLFNLLVEPLSFPDRPLAIINANFSYGVFADIRNAWVANAVEGCKRAGIAYAISQHPADDGDYSEFYVAKDDMYTLIRNGSIVITRFGSTLIEALALGKPVVYHNPHNERVGSFKEPLGAYSISRSAEELSKCLLRELARAGTVRQEAREFLQLHTNHDSCNPQPQGQAIAKALADILRG